MINCICTNEKFESSDENVKKMNETDTEQNKIWQNIYLINDSCPEYIKNTFNSKN